MGRSASAMIPSSKESLPMLTGPSLGSRCSIGNDSFQQSFEMPDHSRDGRRVEEVRVIEEEAAQAGVGIGQYQRHVVFGEIVLALGSALQRHACEPGKLTLFVGLIVKFKRYLKYGWMTGVPCRLYRLYDSFERDILATIGCQRSVADTLQ